MSQYHKKVSENLSQFDDLLSSYPNTSKRFDTLFAVRTEYSLIAPKYHLGARCLAKRLLRFFYNMFIHIFTRTEFENLERVVILGDWHFDEFLSEQTSIAHIKPIIKLSFDKQIFLRITDCFSSFGVGFYMLFYLDFKESIFSLPSILSFYMGRRTSLGECKVLIVENDILPFPYGILCSAKQNNVIRVKVEYAIIDSVLHQNCFCDYYFYPTQVHKKIRENSPYNKDLIYVSGGYLNKFKASNLEYSPAENISVTYFTEHANVMEKNDIYYIDQVLRYLPENGIVNIKVHPYDDISRYDKYLKHPKVNVLHSQDIDNAILIASSTICMSILSTMSLEAKYICPNSYFINFDIEQSPYSYDYKCFNEFFDTIDSPKMLTQVLRGEYTPIEIETFRKNVNMTYPNTFDVFKKFIKSLDDVTLIV